MADSKGPADLDEVFEELERTGALAKFREEFRGGIYHKLPQSVPLLEHRGELLSDIDWTIGQLAAAKAMIMSANTGVAPMLEFTSNNEACFFEEPCSCEACLSSAESLSMSDYSSSLPPKRDRWAHAILHVMLCMTYYATLLRTIYAAYNDIVNMICRVRGRRPLNQVTAGMLYGSQHPR